MEKYTTPELEIMEFELEDVLTISLWDGEGGIHDGWY